MTIDKRRCALLPCVRGAGLLIITIGCSTSLADDSFSYEDIAKRYADSQLSNDDVEKAKMEGECLVGLKNLNFVKREEFDPVAEWTNYRAISLLEQFPPCTVLIMMEVARAELVEEVSSQ